MTLRHPSFLLAAVLAVLVCGPTHAQQGQNPFTATPSPYDTRSGEPLVLTNVGATPAAIDSVAFIRDPDFDGTAYIWTVDLSTTIDGQDYQETIFCPTVLDGGCDLPESIQIPPRVFVIDRPIPSGGTVAARLRAGCEACRGGVGSPLRDTFEVYVEGVPEPLRVSKTAEISVPSEHTPPALLVSVRPTVTTGYAEVAVTSAAPATVEVEVYDTLGRRVTSVRSAVGSGTQRVPLDLSGLAPGRYLVAARVGSDPPATAPVVVVR